VYDPRGERIGTYTVTASGTYPYLSAYLVVAQTNVWFAGKLVNRYNAATFTQGAVYRDRLGSERGGGQRYYPYGDEITSTANDAEKFGTYFRDSFTTLDYADQRYYAGAYGRFGTADPYRASATSGVPLSWNRYNYTLGDPVNGNDRRGLDDDAVDDGGGGGDYGGGVDGGDPDCTENGGCGGGVPVFTVTVTASGTPASTGTGNSFAGGIAVPLGGAFCILRPDLPRRSHCRRCGYSNMGSLADRQVARGADLQPVQRGLSFACRHTGEL